MILQRHANFFYEKKTKHSLINIGSGIEKTIHEFAKFIMRKMRVHLKIKFDRKKTKWNPKKKNLI